MVISFDSRSTDSRLTDFLKFHRRSNSERKIFRGYRKDYSETRSDRERVNNDKFRWTANASSHSKSSGAMDRHRWSSDSSPQLAGGGFTTPDQKRRPIMARDVRHWAIPGSFPSQTHDFEQLINVLKIIFLNSAIYFPRPVGYSESNRIAREKKGRT